MFVFVHSLNQSNNGIRLETTENTKVTKAKHGPNSNAKKGVKTHERGDNPRKFETYFNFQGYFNRIYSHQTLAINRGENLKVQHVLTIVS